MGQQNIGLDCLHCQAQNRPQAQFCQGCGQPLTQRCPHCQANNRLQANFCQQCRRPLREETAVSSQPCSACHQNNKANAHYCRHCGHSLAGGHQLKQKQAIPPGNGDNQVNGTIAATPQPQTTTPCLHCGRPVTADTQICPHCGQTARYLSPVDGRHQTGYLPAQQQIEDSNGEIYLIARLIAQGGQGAVYEAIRPADSSKWAIKELSESVIAPQDREYTIDTFYWEADLLKHLEHDNLPKVIDAFTYNNRHYMVMDLIEGETLTEIINQAQKPIPEADVVAWGSQLCLVLHYLHNQQPPIIYRDLKPDNIMVENGRIKLIDFGIARSFKENKKKDTVHLGTSGYAAPEQYAQANQQSDAQTDIYALGATLHHLLTGLDPAHNPFHFPDVQIHAKVSDQVAEAVSRAVHLRVHKRPKNAVEMFEALTGEKFPDIAVTPISLPTSGQSTSPTPSSATPDSKTDQAMSATLTTIAHGPIEKGEAAELTIPVDGYQLNNDINSNVTWLSFAPEKLEAHTRAVTITINTEQMYLSKAWHEIAYKPAPLAFLIGGFIWWLLLWLTHLHAYFLVPADTTHKATVELGDKTFDLVVTVVAPSSRSETGWFISGSLVVAEVMGLALWLMAIA